MARPNKQGLDYFPFGVNFFEDEKIRFIRALYGNTGINVVIKILCRIYSEGYYTKWETDEIMIFAKYAAFIPEKKLNMIIEEALKRNLFSNDLYQKYTILTSEDIQKVFFTACKSRKHLKIEKQYLLVNPNDYGISKEVYSNETEVNSEITTERKEKEIKVNESENTSISLSDFYTTELLAIQGKHTPLAKAYSDLVSYILGNNELKASLKGLINFKEQLSFDQFNQLWDKKCGVYSKYQSALLKIHEIVEYQKYDSLFSRLMTWFDMDKDQDSLQPMTKPKKVLTV